MGVAAILVGAFPVAVLSVYVIIPVHLVLLRGAIVPSEHAR